MKEKKRYIIIGILVISIISLMILLSKEESKEIEEKYVGKLDENMIEQEVRTEIEEGKEIISLGIYINEIESREEIEVVTTTTTDIANAYDYEITK